jgi:hypothetical protein
MLPLSLTTKQSRRPAAAPRNRRQVPNRARPALERLEDLLVPSVTTAPALSYSGSLAGRGFAVAVDGAGDSYVTGRDQSTGQVFLDKINPTGTALLYSVDLGGGEPNASPVGGYAIAVDAAGDAWVMGWTTPNFPTTPNAFAPTSATAAAFVAELNPTGSAVLYATYLPGTVSNPTTWGDDGGIALDGSGDVYVTGAAGPGFPTTAGAFQGSLAAGAAYNAFFARINPSLSVPASLVYATYLGGGAADAGTGVAVDGAGNAYLTGYASSTNFPTTAGAFRTSLGTGPYDAFVAKFNPSQAGPASLVYSTYLGPIGTAGLIMPDPFIRNQPLKNGPAIAVDAAGNAYVAGGTDSSSSPTTRGAFQPKAPSGGPGKDAGANAFVTKLNATGTGLIYSTYLGGKSQDAAAGIAVDAAGNAYVTGWTRSSDFPTVNPIQAGKTPGVDEDGITPNSDVFVTTLNGTGSGLLFSTFLGGAYNDYGFGIARDAAGDAYVAGVTPEVAGSFPTKAGAFGTTPGLGFAFAIDPPV